MEPNGHALNKAQYEKKGYRHGIGRNPELKSCFLPRQVALELIVASGRGVVQFVLQAFHSRLPLQTRRACFGPVGRAEKACVVNTRFLIQNWLFGMAFFFTFGVFEIFFLIDFRFYAALYTRGKFIGTM